MRYLYEGHMGNLFISDDYLDYEELYCETCGDSDQLLGEFETIEDFWNLIEDKCDINGSGGYSLQYVYPILVGEFELPDLIEYDDCEEALYGCCNAKDCDIINRIEELISRKIIINIKDDALELWDEEVE